MEKAFRGEVFISAETRKELLSLNHKLSKRLNLPQYLEWNTSFLPLLSKMTLAPVAHRVILCRDPKDDAYLSLAKSAHADFLVTGDKDLLSLGRGELEKAGLVHLRIVKPLEFLR